MLRFDRDQVYRSAALQNIPWLEHGFGTRLSSDWPPSHRLTSVRQTHSDRIVVANGKPGVVGEADALITNQAGTLLSVRTADCLPMLLADVRHRAVAAVHAGWRGTLAQIAAKTVRALELEFGSTPDDVRVVMGPGIGPCCFEVGPEVSVQFRTLFPERNDLLGQAKLDLAEANRRQFMAQGISPDHIIAADLCTCCNDKVFESYRRDREKSGRMTHVIGILG